MQANMDVPAAPDLVALKGRQQAAWASGDYAVVGTTLQIVGETLCEAVDLRAGEAVLDVAAGNGNATLAAARRYGQVTSTDYVGPLLDRGRARALAEGLEVDFQTADAENLPFGAGQFDVVLSSFGVMFTADHQKAADELVRVCRRDGRIGMANWTPEGFIGQVFRTIGRHIPPAPGAQSPALWGTEAHLAKLFGDRVRLQITPRSFAFRYRSPAHFVDVFRSWYGPMLKAFAALDEGGRAALERDLLDLIGGMNRAKDGTMVVDSAYAEVVANRA